MKVLSPVNSFLSTQAQIEAGAEEIYVGIKTDLFNRYSFSGRGQSSKACKSTVPEIGEFKDIVTYAHEHNVEVSLVANIPIFSDAYILDSMIEKEYLNYVEKGIKCGIDNVIVGDIGLLYKLGKMHLPINLHASTFMDTMNVEQMLFLKELGVTRSILTYQIGLEEIEALCKKNIMEIEVFGYLSCSFMNGACNMVHDMGEVNTSEEMLIGVPCKAEYIVKKNNKERTLQFYDAELGCALCSLKKLEDMGVDVIKIVGRDRDYKMIVKITKLFHEALESAKSMNQEMYLEKLDGIKYAWWKKIWCSKKLCKYKDNRITQSYIGV